MDRRTFLKSTAAVTGTAALPLAALSTAEAVTVGPAGRTGGRVRTGFETMADDRYALLRGQRVGLISNPTGVVQDLRHEVDAMVASGEVDLVAAFGPEHGFRGSAQAGGSEGSYTDPRTGVPVYDTYGKGPSEIAGFLRDAGVDTVMFDIQDVGARFYTYIWTMYDCMVAASSAGVRFLVLDRPNPTSGEDAYGPVLHPEFSTFVGRKPIAQQHGMTVGELAGLFNAEFLPEDDTAAGPVDLVVSRMDGWDRPMFHEEAAVPWVMPSPNMPTVDTAVVYPGTCLFEATNLSEGRGTTRPFELIGAPYVDYRWSTAMQEQELPGVHFREAYFTPSFSKHQGTSCGAVQVHVFDRGRFEAIRTAIAMIVTAKRMYPSDFAWRESGPPYWIDRLTGSEQVRHAIDGGADADEVVAGWQGELREFRRSRRRYLLYPAEQAGIRTEAG
ncbi:MAG: exo-beta-N-acetylmuramidase NamZ domain-containing protein [Nocardioidaceae bacterium]